MGHRDAALDPRLPIPDASGATPGSRVEELLLEVSNLTKLFGGLAAVKDVSFTVARGEFLGLIGPNGAGKTTLFNLVAGYHSPTSGSIRFRGEDITSHRPYEICRRGIARTFQIVKPLGKMTALENVMVGALLNTNSVRRAEEVALETLEFCRLLSKKDYLARSLTLGERKRLEVARALATKPDLLLLDEVVAGLNPAETEDMVELILKKLRDRGITLIAVEHVMRVIMSVSDRILVLHHGQKIAEGTPAEIVANPAVIDAYLGESYA